MAFVVRGSLFTGVHSENGISRKVPLFFDLEWVSILLDCSSARVSPHPSMLIQLFCQEFFEETLRSEDS